MPKILFIAAHRTNRSPSQRFRFEQYFSFLQTNGFECVLSPLLNEEEDKTFYSKGNFLRKAGIVAKCFFKRRQDIRKAKGFDIIFIQREAFMTGTLYFEKQFKHSGKKIIFDFDDAIWLPNVSEGNKNHQWLKNPDKTNRILSISDLVIAGNNYLSGYVKKFNENVVVIPTTVDTAYHRPPQRTSPHEKICIGWTGSHTTIPHFEFAFPSLIELKKKFGEKIYFKLIGDSSYENSELNLKGIPWNLETEINDLSEIDIGIMPLPDTPWTRGKCGLKGLQCMALEIPTVMSPIGVNCEIISDGKNGFLAEREEEWVEKIFRLIESEELRKKIGKEARKTVEEKYSVISQQEKYLQYFRKVLTASSCSNGER